MTIIGIDLGTTNSLAACWLDGQAVIIPNALGKPLTPSVVSIGTTGEIIIGQTAKERLITHPQLTAAAFKRYMGTRREIMLGNRKFLPEELSSLVIRSLKQDAQAYLNQPVTEAVISVPAYFNDAQRKATKRAGELAGLKVERLINEPTAAAIAYGLHQNDPETKFLVFDLGGGTFDVSIVERFENLLEVKAIAGDNYLGGEDFTELLIQLFISQHALNREHLTEKQLAVIYKQAEHCKQNLTQNKAGTISCNLNGINYNQQIAHTDFLTAAEPLLDKLRQPITRALNDAAVTPPELDAIILVGGATRMPLIYTIVSRLFGRLPACNLNPDEVVAIGAGIQAAMKARNNLLKDIVLTDVCPYTLGTEIVIQKTPHGSYESGHFFPIIERNTVIPVSRVKRLYTVHDNQATIAVEILQGESRLTKNNIFLGRLDIAVPPAPAGEQAIDIRFTYDINGILEVEVTVVATGCKQRLIIEESPGSMSQDEIEQRLAALAELKIHPRDNQENQLLLARGERLYEETLGEARQQIAMLLAQFEQTLDQQNERQIRAAAANLKQQLAQFEHEF